MTIKEFIKLGGSIHVDWSQTAFYQADTDDINTEKISEVSDLLQVENWKELIDPDESDFNDNSDTYTIYGPDNVALADNLDEDEANDFIANLTPADLMKNTRKSPY